MCGVSGIVGKSNESFERCQRIEAAKMRRMVQYGFCEERRGNGNCSTNCEPYCFLGLLKRTVEIALQWRNTELHSGKKLKPKK